MIGTEDVFIVTVSVRQFSGLYGRTVRCPIYAQ
jgi:hypothetical protein